MPDLRLVPLRFSDLPGWEADDHLAAFKAFIRSAKAFERPAGVASGKTRTADEALVAAVRRAADRAAGITTAAGARAFFEESFVPHRVEHRGAGGCSPAIMSRSFRAHEPEPRRSPFPSIAARPIW